MTSPLLTFDGFVPGNEQGVAVETIGADLCEQWSALYPWDRVDAEGRVPVGMSSVLMMRAYQKILSPRPPGNVHAGQRFVVHARPRVGESLESRMRCLSKTMRGERRFVEMEMTTTGDGGRAVFTGVMTMIWAK